MKIRFDGDSHPPVELAIDSNLSEHLTKLNSPVLFGCRTGICGTCVIEIIESESGSLPPPSLDEKETLEVYAPGNSRARLACQMPLTASIKLKYLGK